MRPLGPRTVVLGLGVLTTAGCAAALPQQPSTPTMRCARWSEEPDPMGTSSVSALVLAGGPSRAQTQGCLLDRSGQVACWGNNDPGPRGSKRHGRLVGGTSATWERPALVRGLPKIIHIAGQRGVFCALGDAGDIYCWGHERSCGPVYVDTLPGAVSLALSRWGLLGLTSDGTVYTMAWIGPNDVASYWRTGTVEDPVPASAGALVPDPGISTSAAATSVVRAPSGKAFPFKVTGHHRVRMPHLPPLVEIQGDDQACGLDEDGGLYCWGPGAPVRQPGSYERFAVVGSGVCGVQRGATTTACRQSRATIDFEDLGPLRAMSSSCVLSHAGVVRCRINGNTVSFVEPRAVSVHEGLAQVCTIDTAGAARCRDVVFEGAWGLGQTMPVLVPSAGAP